MTRPTTPLWLAATLATLTLSGCHLWFDDDCRTYGAPELDAVGLLNPYTGQCEWQGGGGGGDICGDWGGGAGDAIVPAEPLDWAQCYGACSGLGEADCQAASGCRAAYVGDCPEGFLCDNTTYTFAACWDVAPSGPVQGPEPGFGCEGLDAYQCSLRDDCSPHHYPYDSCASAPAGADCAPGMVEPGRAGNFEHCAAEPSPSRGTCYGEVYCDSLPPACPADSVPGVIDGCWSGACIPLSECEPEPAPPACAELTTENECIGRVDCTPVYVGVNCTCDPQTGECICQDWLFEQCSDA